MDGGTQSTTDGSLHFRAYLRAELLRRCRTNPRYSLRAFGRALKYDVSSLSKILQGKRPLGPRTIQRFGESLGLNQKTIRQYIYEERVQGAEGYLAPSPQEPFHQLSLDTFEVISDWYHYAILELTSTKGFRPSVRWIANTLGITEREVQLAVNRLRRVGLLSITKEGKWVEVNGDRLTTTGNPDSASAFRNMQRQLLWKALNALEEIPIEERDHSSMTMAIDTRKLKQAKIKIKKFRRELCAYLTRVDERDAVYAMTIALFPVNVKKRKNTL